MEDKIKMPKYYKYTGSKQYMGIFFMIVMSCKPYGIIKGSLKKWKKIGLIACNTCARVCETGGKEKMEELAERLKADGYDVVDTALIPMACNLDLAKKPDLTSDVLVILACDSGVFTFATIYPSKKVVAANNTLGLGARDGQGNIYLMKKFDD
jgi:ferredoxin